MAKHEHDGCVEMITSNDGYVVFYTVTLGGLTYGCDQRNLVPRNQLALFDAIADTLSGRGVHYATSSRTLAANVDNEPVDTVVVYKRSDMDDDNS